MVGPCGGALSWGPVGRDGMLKQCCAPAGHKDDMELQSSSPKDRLPAPSRQPNPGTHSRPQVGLYTDATRSPNEAVGVS